MIASLAEIPKSSGLWSITNAPICEVPGKYSAFSKLITNSKPWSAPASIVSIWWPDCSAVLRPLTGSNLSGWNVFLVVKSGGSVGRGKDGNGSPPYKDRLKKIINKNFDLIIIKRKAFLPCKGGFILMDSVCCVVLVVMGVVDVSVIFDVLASVTLLVLAGTSNELYYELIFNC